MSKNIKFNISFINHLNKNINLNNFLVNVETGSFLYEINKGYVNLDFVTNKVYYDPKIVGDDVERIEVKYQIDDNEVQAEKFCIEAIEYLSEENIKVYCRSKSFKYDKYYLNKTINGDDLIEVLSNIFEDIELNFDNFTNLAFAGSLDVKNKTGFEVVEELRNSYKFEYYYRQGVIYFCDKKVIKKDDIAIKRFSEISDIESLNTSTDLFKKRVKKIIINEEKEEIETFKPSLKMDIKPSPQPTSPNEVLVYTDDDGNKYKLAPVKAQFLIYFSPKSNTLPYCNLDTELKEKIVVEKYTLNNENCLRLTAHIKSLLGIEGADYYSYNIGDNLLLFDKKISGEVKVSYKTDVLVGIIENSKYPKDILINVKYLDRAINYAHKIELNRYYPIPYDLTLNTISDWGLEADVSINKIIQVSKYDKDSQAFVSLTSINSNEFGDFTLSISEYGTYKFDMEGQESLYLDYFVNKMEIYMNEVNC